MGAAPSSAELELLGFADRWCGVEQLGATLLSSSVVFHLKLGTHSKANLQPRDALGVCLVIVSLPCS